MKTKVYPFVHLVFVVIAIRWLFISGFIPTHDGEYHLMRIHEFGTMLLNGYWFPRWAPDLNSKFGLPLFNFFYPFPNYVGVLFHQMGWNLVDSLKLTLATGYVVANVFCFQWLQKMFDRRSALAGSVVFAFVPYWFVDIFVRGSVGEVWAIAFLMSCLFFIENGNKRLLAAGICGIIVSHNILSILFLPFLILYASIRSRQALVFILIGIVLATYFWLPALLERSFVVGLNTVNFKDHFPDLSQLLVPSWGTGFSGKDFVFNEMSYQIGVVPMAVALIAVILVVKHPKNPMKSIALLFLLCNLASFVLMQEMSIPLWEIIRPLQFLQYPWRLLSFMMPVSGFLATYTISTTHNRVIVIAFVIFAIAAGFSYTKPVVYASRDDQYYLSRSEFTDGTSSLGNFFSTRWMLWQPNRPKERMEIVSGDGSVIMRREGVATFTGDTRLTTDAMVRVHVAYYPGWRVAIDGKSSSVQPDEKGMITVSVPKGDHSIAVSFGETPLRLAADIFSLACILWLICFPVLRKHRN
ncbi:hypothetical protein A2973_00795 [Candidatus Gottesmanbacteria bacterium RIFCSPLOWO2_01_FULL_49_10]|uniref:Membrane protein 6-pyruvoyl-tetrahydropterin synthase-related domain-containing protein n=1 Tax=Candidatus Gottesmanbacteria bacterium RIFCSPLOWO2_01_FULL_49_10 TaxID=1798396 RepID=A0A1F6AX68_9BACT|nr:MAG: hypothetical protein A2973_00795 [Candidatus Gottesmanbacteria bacterium RIFCSPLOWO2_01_FULL_49_10]